MWLLDLFTYRKRRRKALAEAEQRADLAELEYWYARTYLWPEDDEKHKKDNSPHGPLDD